MVDDWLIVDDCSETFHIRTMITISYLSVELVFKVVVLSDPRDLGLNTFLWSESANSELHEQFHLARCRQDAFQFHRHELFQLHDLTLLSATIANNVWCEIYFEWSFCFLYTFRPPTPNSLLESWDRTLLYINFFTDDIVERSCLRYPLIKINKISECRSIDTCSLSSVGRYSQHRLLRTCSVRTSGSTQQRAAYDQNGIVLRV